jgi:hypothetical protein
MCFRTKCQRFSANWLSGDFFLTRIFIALKNSMTKKAKDIDWSYLEAIEANMEKDKPLM